MFLISLEVIKHTLKKYLKYYKVRNQLSERETRAQKELIASYQASQSNGNSVELKTTGRRVFSQFEEDGKLLYLFSLLRMSCPTFIEFGADDGINSNSANLFYHHNFNGLFLDENSKAIERGRYFFKRHPNGKREQPTFIRDMITAENINSLLTEGGMKGEIGLLSIDIDGNDYWVWKAIHVVSPQVVIIETHNEFGLNDIIAPYDPEYMYPGKHPTYHGASPVAMTKLAKHKGYRLVGSNDLGFNFIFLRDDLLTDLVPEVSVESLLQHPSNVQAQQRFEAVKDWEYVTESF